MNKKNIAELPDFDSLIFSHGQWLMDVTDGAISDHPNRLPIVRDTKNGESTLIALINHESGTIPLREYLGNAVIIHRAPEMLKLLIEIYPHLQRLVTMGDNMKKVVEIQNRIAKIVLEVHKATGKVHISKE